MKSIIVQYSYPSADEQQLQAILLQLESKIGGERKPYFLKGSAFDLVTCLEFILTFTGGVAFRSVIQKYLEGLLGTDGLKSLGEHHRRQVQDWFSALGHDVTTVAATTHDSLQLIQPPILVNERNEAIAIQIQLRQGTLHVVLNHKASSPELLENLSAGVASAIRYLSENNIDCEDFQLYFDIQYHSWKYLFVPTLEDDQQRINRYVDLDTGEMIHIISPSDFRQIFQPAIEDEYKFLFSPFRGDEDDENEA